MSLSTEELSDLIKEVEPYLQGNIIRIMSKLNRTEKLDEFLELIGKPRRAVNVYSTRGKIIVLGQSQAKRNKLQGIMKSMKIASDRLELYPEYGDAKSFDYMKLQYSAKYSLVIVGPMGHKAQGIGNNSSPIAMMESTEGYPPIRKMGGNVLKVITKSGFRNVLSKSLQEGFIQTDLA